MSTKSQLIPLSIKSIQILRFSLLFLLFNALNFTEAQDLNTQAIADSCMSSVCYIQTNEGMGTGFIIDNTKGIIVTNAHVIEESRDNEIHIGFRDSPSNYGCDNIINISNKWDLALIKSKKNFSGRKSLPLLNKQEKIKTGEKIAIIGKPHNLSMSINQGNISSLLNDYDITDGYKETHLLQTDASINPGNSGGPIINKYGQVVGVIVARLEKTYEFQRKFEGMGYGIKVKFLKEFLKENKIKYETSRLITEVELAGANLTERQKDSIRLIKIHDIEEQKKLKDSLERVKIKKQKQAELKQQKLNQKQKKKLAKRKFQLKKEKQEAYYEKKIQQEKTEKAKLKRKNERDKLKLEKEKQQLKERKRTYKENLPTRILVRFGSSAHYLLKNPVLTAISWNYKKLYWQLRAGLTYRTDLPEEETEEKVRGTAIGLFARYGNYISQTFEAWPANNRDLNSYQPYREIEVGMLLKEWFRLSFGKGWQKVYKQKDLSYYVLTTGFVARLKRLELTLSATGMTNNTFKNFSVRLQSGLGLRFGWGKW